MGKRIKKLKKIRIHHEGTNTLLFSAIALIIIALILWCIKLRLHKWEKE